MKDPDPEFFLYGDEQFATWAREKGGPPERDPVTGDVRSPFTRLDEATVRQDMMILKQFETHVRGREGDTYGALLTHAESWKAWLETKKEPLQPVSVERYLVAVRRYFRFRFRGQPRVGTEPKGPFIPKKKPRLLAPASLDEWIKAVDLNSDPKLKIATWLLLDGFSVDELVDLEYGNHIRESDDGAVEIRRPDQVTPAPAAIAPVLGRGLQLTGGRGVVFAVRPQAKGKGGRFLPTDSPDDRPGPRAPMTTQTLRLIWRELRDRIEPRGPTMRDVAVVGRAVTIRFEAGELVYEPRPGQLVRL